LDIIFRMTGVQRSEWLRRGRREADAAEVFRNLSPSDQEKLRRQSPFHQEWTDELVQPLKKSRREVLPA
jgi:hypothetical protein